MTIGPSGKHRDLQSAAKQVLNEIIPLIDCKATEKSILRLAMQLLAQRGISTTWYYDCMALVLLGSRSCISISARSYLPDDELVGNHNLVTIDLSPAIGTHWGDCARSIYVEEGIARAVPIGSEFLAGHQLLMNLHDEFRHFASPSTTLDEVFQFAEQRIAAAGFENLDRLGNVGHSIATTLTDRTFIERGNQKCLREFSCFTFEPHVRHCTGKWGFKHENIYYFDPRGTLLEL